MLSYYSCLNVVVDVRIHPDQALAIFSDIVASFALVDADFALGSHVCSRLALLTGVSERTYNESTDSNARPLSVVPSNSQYIHPWQSWTARLSSSTPLEG